MLLYAEGLSTHVCTNDEMSELQRDLPVDMLDTIQRIWILNFAKSILPYAAPNACMSKSWNASCIPPRVKFSLVAVLEVLCNSIIR